MRRILVLLAAMAVVLPLSNALAGQTEATQLACTNHPKATPARHADGGFAVASLQAKDDGLGDIGGTVRIKNTSGKAVKVLTFTITFFKSSKVVGTAQGAISGGLRPGQTKTASLLSTDKMYTGAVRYQFQVDVAL
jgi:hypothetical protein